MDLNNLPQGQVGRWEQELADEGLLVVPDVELPATFMPPITDLVFTWIGDRIEVCIGSWNEYAGPHPQWAEICAGEERPGRVRLVGEGPGNFREALNWARRLINDGAAPRGTRPAQARLNDQGGGAAAESAALPAVTQTGVPHDQPQTRVLLRDLVAEARQNPREFVGREQELVELMTCLLRESKPGVVLLGPPGCGKTALVHMLAQRLAVGAVPLGLSNVPVYQLDLSDLAGNDRQLGQMQEAVRELADLPGRPVLFADELHQLAALWELRPLLDLLKPALAEGRLRLVGASTPVEWRQVRDRAFIRRLTEVVVREPSATETLHMLRPRLPSLAAHHRLQISEDDLWQSIRRAARYMPHRAFPDKALDMLDQAAAMQQARATPVPTTLLEDTQDDHATV